MKSRILPLLALLGALLLSACGGDSGAPAATATTAPAVASTSATAPGAASATGEPATPAPTIAPTEAAPATPAATATAPQAAATTSAAPGGEEPALTLQSVPIETDNTTRTGTFATDRQLNL